MAHIYKLVFPNGKIYIGQTTVEPRLRFNRHRTACKAGSDVRLCRAWRKHGDPVLEVLYEVPDKDRFDWEVFEIAMRDSTGPDGYNATKGGEGALLTDPVAKEKRRQKLRAVPRTKEWYEKVSKARMGHEVSQECRAKISASLQTHFDLYGPSKRVGKPQTEETRAKISNTMKGVPKSAETRERMRAAQQKRSAELATRHALHGRPPPKKQKNPRPGTPHTEAAKAKIRAASLLREARRRAARAALDEV